MQVPFDITTFGGLSSSKTSSIAGSILGRSQLSSALYDISADESITTVTRRSPSMESETATVIINDRDPLLFQRLKTVAFDIEPDSVAIGKYIPVSHVSKGLLYRQYSVRAEKRNRNLPITILRRASDVSGLIDSLHDDSLGLAPLASPETLSEISSISSRTSAPISLANSIELYFHNLNLGVDNTSGRAMLEGIFESQLHTPKIMRRAPKFSENLSNCAEDSRNVDQYKRMGRVFVTFPPIFDGVHSNNNNQKSSFESSDDSYESVQSLSRLPSKHDHSTGNDLIGSNVLQQKQSSKSADPLDSVAVEQKQTEHTTKKLTFSDSEILNDVEATVVKDNYSLTFEHNRSLTGALGEHTNCGSADMNFYSANSSIEQFSTPGKLMYYSNSVDNGSLECQSVPEEAIVIRPGVLESHFPVFESVSYLADHNSAETIDDSDIPTCSTSTNVPIKQIKRETIGGRIRKRLSSEDFIFTRTEDFPRVSQLGEKSNKRKAAIYPAGSRYKISRGNPSTYSNNQMINTTTTTAATVTKSSSNLQLERKFNHLNSQYSSNYPIESPNIMLPITYSEESSV